MEYVMSLRDDYNDYEEKVKELFKTEIYVLDKETKRRPKRKKNAYMKLKAKMKLYSAAKKI